MHQCDCEYCDRYESEPPPVYYGPRREPTAAELAFERLAAFHVMPILQYRGFTNKNGGNE